MKICWDNLEKIYLTRNGNLKKRNGHIYIEKESCIVCNEPYLTLKRTSGDFCSKSCAKMGNTSHLGFKHSEETKKKISESEIGNKYWLGKKHTEKSKKKNSESHKDEKHPNWKGGITPINARIRSSSKYKNWREKIFGRDNFTCQKTKQKGGNLNAHHIFPVSKFPDLIFTKWNGITLAKDFHKKIRGNEQYYVRQFLEITLKDEVPPKKNWIICD